MTDTLLTIVFQLLLGGLLGVSSGAKLASHRDFSAELYQVTGLPKPIAAQVALGVCVLEALIAIWLGVGLLPQAAFTAAAVLMVAFIAWTFGVYRVRRRAWTNCQCLGALTPAWWNGEFRAYSRNVLLSLVALAGSWMSIESQMHLWGAIFPLASITFAYCLTRRRFHPWSGRSNQPLLGVEDFTYAVMLIHVPGYGLLCESCVAIDDVDTFDCTVSMLTPAAL